MITICPKIADVFKEEELFAHIHSRVPELREDRNLTLDLVKVCRDFCSKWNEIRLMTEVYTK